MKSKSILLIVVTILALLLFGCSKEKTRDDLASGNEKYKYINVIDNTPSDYIDQVDITK